MLHANIAIKVGSSHKVCLNHLWIILVRTCMHVLHLGLGLHSKVHPNNILGISKQPYMWVLHLRLPFHYKFYFNHLWVIFKMNLNIAIAFRVKVSYKFAISRHVLCRNPTLAKCGGEAQHFQSWGFGVLWDSQMFRAQ
jgi:hypothetical protein